MRALLLFILGFLLIFPATSQQPLFFSLSSNGSFATSQEGSLSWNLGEISTSTYHGNSDILTEGFCQNFDLLSNTAFAVASNSFNIYPNPFQQEITIENLSQDDFDGKILIADLQGKILERCNNTIQNRKQSVDLSSLADGIYFLSVFDNRNSLLQLEKIIKIKN